VRQWDEEVKGRKDEKFEWEGEMDWGWIPRMELSGGGVGAEK
jgi:hypothetical protein